MGLNFEPRKPPQAPTAALMDPEAAQEVLDDAMEALRCMGDVPLVVESHATRATIVHCDHIISVHSYRQYRYNIYIYMLLIFI